MPRFMVLEGQGWNCQDETAHAIQLAGGQANQVYIKHLIEKPEILQSYQGLIFPGGFTYGDDISSGRVAAADLEPVKDELQKFLDDKKVIAGICNGFQIAVWLGLAPALDNKYLAGKKASLVQNDSGKFEDRWVYLKNAGGNCIWTKDVDVIYLPVRHGEGKFVAPPEVLEEIERQGLIAFRYCDKNGNTSIDYPLNPNGAMKGIAGVCSYTTLFMMPHPEAHVYGLQHPRWTRENVPEEGDGMKIFRNAVKYFE